MRVSQKSLGIAVDNFPMNAYGDLTRVAQKSANPPTSTLAHTIHPHQIDALKAKCHDQFIVFIKQVLQDFYEGLENRLIQAAYKSSNFAENRLFHTIHPLISARRAETEHAFLDVSYLQQNFDQCPASVDQYQCAQLALVDTDDFEDWLNISQAINELGCEHQAALENFERRYRTLAPSAATAHDNPYGPYFIFQTFRKGIADIDLTYRLRAWLYKAFFESLSRLFADFYQGLNETLAFIAVAENPKTAAVRGTGTARKTKDTDADPKPDGPTPAPGRDSELPSSQHTTGTAADHLGNDQLEYKLDNLLQHLNTPQTAFNAPIDHLVFHGQAGLADSPAIRTGSLIPAMSSLFNAAHGAREESVKDGQPGAEIPPSSQAHKPGVNLNTILDVLNRARLQQDGQTNKNDHISIKRRLTAEFPQLENGATGSDKYFQAIHLFDALLSKPLTDDTQGSDIRALLKKLEIPLLKLALLDEKFLESDVHPARQIVNLFERCYVAADDSGKIFDPKLLMLLHRLANRVVDNFEASPGVFDEANGILGNLLKPIENVRKKNVSRIQLISEGGEKIHLVRDQVEQAIRLRLGGKMVPKIVLALLDAGWRHYLQTTSLRLGQDSAEYQRALALLDDLLELLTPDVIANGIDPKKIQQLATYVLEKLKETLFDEATFQEITHNLSKQLQGINPVEFQFHSSGEPDATAKQSPGDAEIRQLRKGDWLSFAEQGTPVPHQLVWSNTLQNRFVFTNRSATKKRHLDQHELALAIKNGTATKIPGLDAPFMERSAHKVMLDAYERLYHQATHDPETGLLNRKGLMNQLEKIFAAGIAENQGDILCLMMFDQLKAIYHSCDPAEAEASLLSVVESLSKAIQPADLFSRQGEDAFAVLFRGHTLETGYATAQNMVSAIQQHRVKCQDKSFVLGVNAGIAQLSKETDSPSTLLKQAGSACVVAKSKGGNLVQRYEKASSQIKDDQALFEWAGIIDKALNENLLFLRCQKIQPVLSDNGGLPHYEILLGLHNSLDIQPAGFIRAAERWKRSADIDQWVLRNSFNWIRENAPRLGSVGGFSINLSGLSLVNENVLDFIRTALGAHDLPPEKIIFEITENAAIERLEAAQGFIDEIKTYGCRFSLDDFGSGYSSFAYLKGLKVDYLKIDGSFIRDLLKERNDFAMVKSMHEVGHSLGLKTIAEYVESAAILDKLKEIGIDYAQGYAIEKPMPLHQLIPD